MTSTGHSALSGIPICCWRTCIKAFYKAGCLSIGSDTLAQLADWLFSQEPVRLTARFGGSWFIRSSFSNSATAYQMAMTLNTPWTVTLSSLLAVCSTKQSQIEGKLSLAIKYYGCMSSWEFMNSSTRILDVSRHKLGSLYMVSLTWLHNATWKMHIAGTPAKINVWYFVNESWRMSTRQWKKADVVQWRGIALHDRRRTWDDSSPDTTVKALQCGHLCAIPCKYGAKRSRHLKA